ncbi:MAG: hypothetical protein LBT11_01630, partial [Treponema sp.]|nr:hypothetical protein [Treponema sp.]
MAHRQDYIPRPEAAFSKWAQYLLKYVNDKCTGAPPAWTHIPPEALAALAGQLEDWDTAYATA